MNQTTILKGTKIIGKITCQNGVSLQGEVVGSIRSNGTVNIKELGSLEGDIYSNQTIISGSLQGNIKANTVEIHAGGAVNGSIAYKELYISPKGRFEGTCDISQESATPVISKK